MARKHLPTATLRLSATSCEPAIRDRLALFAERTRPLIDHYRRKGARIVTIDIGPTSTAEETWQVLNETL